MDQFIEVIDLKDNKILINTKDIVYIEQTKKDTKLYIRTYNTWHITIYLSFNDYPKLIELLNPTKV